MCLKFEIILICSPFQTYQHLILINQHFEIGGQIEDGIVLNKLIGRTKFWGWKMKIIVHFIENYINWLFT